MKDGRDYLEFLPYIKNNYSAREFFNGAFRQILSYVLAYLLTLQREMFRLGRSNNDITY